MMDSVTFNSCFDKLILSYVTGKTGEELLDAVRYVFSDRRQLILRLLEDEMSRQSHLVPDEELEKKIYKYWKFYHQLRLD